MASIAIYIYMAIYIIYIWCVTAASRTGTLVGTIHTSKAWVSSILHLNPSVVFTFTVSECGLVWGHSLNLLMCSWILYHPLSVQSLSHVQLFAAPWTAACQASLSFTISEFPQTHVHWVGDAIQPSHPQSSPSPPAFNLSLHQGLFQWISSLHPVTKVLEFQLQHQSFQWIFRTDFLWDWLVWSPCSPRDSQESPPMPQFKSISSSALRAFFMVQLSHPYMTTGKTIALTIWTFAGKVMSLIFNTLSQFFIAF